MERKFKILDDVIISGSHTGIGDVVAYIINYSFSKMHRAYFYDARDSNGQLYHVSERFLEKFRMTSDRVIKESKKMYYESHTSADSAYEPYAVIGGLASSYDLLLVKYEKLEEKHYALENQQNVLNPIS